MDKNVFYFLIGAAAIIVVSIIVLYNRLARLRNKIKQSKSGIDVFLQRRFDLIPNLVETVKGYMQHEENVFTTITELRTNYNKSKDIKSGYELNEKVISLYAVAENYPELKANETMLNLQKVLRETEDDLAASRRLYNSNVTLYNSTIQQFPMSIIAFLFGFDEAELFKADEETKNNVKVEL